MMFWCWPSARGAVIIARVPPKGQSVCVGGIAIVVGATVGVTIRCPGGMMLAVGVVFLVTGDVVMLQDASKKIKQEPTRESNWRLRWLKYIQFSAVVFQEIKISLH